MRVPCVVAGLLATGLVAASLVGCTAPVRTIPGVVRILPVAVRSAGLGGILRGTIRVEQIQGSYVVSNGKLSCHGSYALATWSPMMLVSILCDDGRKGTASVHNAQNKFSGRGTLTMNDGSTGEFVFGGDAAKLWSKMR